MDFQELDILREKIRNEYAIPCYLQFCKDNGLTSFFLSANHSLDLKENYFLYHGIEIEMMNCFNNLKEPFIYVDNKICHYSFESVYGHILLRTWDMDEFLLETNDNLNKLSAIEKQLEKARSFINGYSYLFISLVVILLGSLLPIGFTSLFPIIACALFILYMKHLEKKHFYDPLNDNKKQKIEYERRLEDVKTQQKQARFGTENF